MSLLTRPSSAFKALNRWPKLSFERSSKSLTEKQLEKLNQFPISHKYAPCFINEEIPTILFKIDTPITWTNINENPEIDISLYLWFLDQFCVLEITAGILDKTDRLRVFLTYSQNTTNKILSNKKFNICFKYKEKFSNIYIYSNRNILSRMQDINAITEMKNWTNIKEYTEVWNAIDERLHFLNFLWWKININEKQTKKTPTGVKFPPIKDNKLALQVSWANKYVLEIRHLKNLHKEIKEVSLTDFEKVCTKDQKNFFGVFPELKEWFDETLKSNSLSQLLKKSEKILGKENHPTYLWKGFISLHDTKVDGVGIKFHSVFHILCDYLQQLFDVHSIDPIKTKYGIQRNLYKQTIDYKIDICTKDLNADVIIPNNDEYWLYLEKETFIFGDVLTGLDVPLRGSFLKSELKNIKSELTDEQIEEQLKIIDSEIILAKRWSVPWGARVDLRLGQFRWLDIYPLGTEFVLIFRDPMERYFPLSFNSKDNSIGCFTKTIDIHSKDFARPLFCLFLIAKTIVRDFLVFEDRESLFGSYTKKRVRASQRNNDPIVIYIPRVIYKKPISIQKFEKNTAETLEKTLHNVTEHLRKAENASIHQVVLAEKYGIHVPKGYTFVRPHQRGLEEHEQKLKIYRSRSYSQMLYTQDFNVQSQQIPDWFKFERDTEALMEKLNYEIIQREVRGRGDGGVDIKAFDKKTNAFIVVQCKCWSNPVGPNIVRELIGVISMQNIPTSGIIVTTSKFTEGAVSEAKAANIRLIDGASFNSYLD